MNVKPIMETLNILRPLWERRREAFLGWHGIGRASGDDKRLICFLQPGTDPKPLQDAIFALETSVEMRFIPRFSNKRIFKSNVAAPLSFSSTLESGKEVSAFNQLCGGEGCLGTMGAFLQFVPPQKGDSVWLLSAAHILARVKKCPPKEIRDRDGNPISTMVSTVPVYPEMDIAIAQLDSAYIASSKLRVNSLSPVTPAQNTPVKKVGFKTGLTRGVILYSCPVMDVGHCDDEQSSELGNLIMIASLRNEKPFLDVGDSGALVTSENGLPVGILTALSEDDDPVFRVGRDAEEGDDPVPPFGLATELVAVIPALQKILKDPTRRPLAITLKPPSTL